MLGLQGQTAADAGVCFGDVYRCMRRSKCCGAALRCVVTRDSRVRCRDLLVGDDMAAVAASCGDLPAACQAVADAVVAMLPPR